MSSMRACVYRCYGGPEVVQVEYVPKPSPGKREILIKVHATTVSSGDWRVRTLNVPAGFGFMARLMLGVTGPRQEVLGTELSGVVEAVGDGVTKFKPGDAVFAFPGETMGCHAQYKVLPEDAPVTLKPENLSFAEAAALSFGGTTALHFLRKADLKPGQKVLVIGASGCVGNALVQIAKHMGAQVIGVTSTDNVELVQSIGADRVIDYTKTRDYFAEEGETYDIIADTVDATSFSECQHALTDDGRMLAIAGGLSDLLAAIRTSRSRKRVIAGMAGETLEDIEQLAELAKSGAFRPVIDERQFDMDQIVDAHALVDTKHKKGSVVVHIHKEE